MQEYQQNTTPVVRVHVFPDLPRTTLACISAGRAEAAKVWVCCRDLHQTARTSRTRWPDMRALQAATRGRFALHSQSIQQVFRAFLGAVDTTRQRRAAGDTWMKYPWRDKRYYPLLWPAQAVAITARHIILPMGRGRASIVLPKPEGFVPGACKLVWNGSANELHVTVEVSAQAERDSAVVATVDLGQIHQCAVTTNTGAALIVSGRGQRSLKRRQNKMHGEIARRQSRCQKGSRRWKKLARARHKHAGRIERQVRDLAHKGTRAVADFCAAQDVGTVFIGDPHGVRKKRNGRKHNQRMAAAQYLQLHASQSEPVGRRAASYWPPLSAQAPRLRDIERRQSAPQPSGSTGATRTIWPRSWAAQALRASPGVRGEPQAGVRNVATSTSRKAACGSAERVASQATATSWAV